MARCAKCNALRRDARVWNLDVVGIHKLLYVYERGLRGEGASKTMILCHGVIFLHCLKVTLYLGQPPVRFCRAMYKPSII